MSGRYASYCNAFLFHIYLWGLCCLCLSFINQAYCERDETCTCEEDCHFPDKCLSFPPCCEDFQCPDGYFKDDNNVCVRKASCVYTLLLTYSIILLFLNNSFLNKLNNKSFHASKTTGVMTTTEERTHPTTTTPITTTTVPFTTSVPTTTPGKGHSCPFHRKSKLRAIRYFGSVNCKTFSSD